MRTHPSVVLAFALAVVACGGGSEGSGDRGGSDNSGGGSAGTLGAGAGSVSTNVTTGTAGSALVTYGDPYEGGEFHLGPVDYDETQWHNACAPGTKYAQPVRQAEGVMLAGIWNGIPDVASYCDACIWVVTAKGKSAMLRVVTYGDTTPNSIDVSPEAFQILDTGEYPRLMTWHFAKCPETGAMMYEFQTGANQWWTSLWVRNARVPLTKVEVQSTNHGRFVELERGGDGTLTDGGGFGQGTFSLRSTGVDGQQVVDSFPWPSPDIAGAFLAGQGNFQ